MNLVDTSGQFVGVIENHKGILFKIANSFCQNSEDQKDLVQEIVLQLWRSFSNYSREFKYSTWIYRIALNVAISYQRREHRRKQNTQALPEEIFGVADTGMADSMNEHLLLLQQFIAELKDLDKALMLLYLEEKSQKEIGEIMGLSESNVATKVGRIKNKLKQKFLSLKTT